MTVSIIDSAGEIRINLDTLEIASVHEEHEEIDLRNQPWDEREPRSRDVSE